MMLFFQEMLKKVEDFQNMSNQKVHKIPALVSTELYELRYELMREENKEYVDACDDNDLTEVLDALVDKAYILFGTINAHGMQSVFEEAFNRVHDNNSLKCPGGICEFREDGKLKKPANHPKVELNDLVK